ncbi:MAG: 30S ribosomal protein S17 [Actinomycetota bacterium]|nr:30S ribosomal protein S17 [Actinomycetota bacterium]
MAEETDQERETGMPEPDVQTPEVPGEPESQPASGPAAPQGAPPPAGSVPGAEVLAPKERRQRVRSAKAGKVPARSARPASERQEERVAQRREKAGARGAVRQRARAKARASRGGAVATPPREHEPGKQKTRQGVVVSDRAQKTIVVRIDTARRHRRYTKIVRTSSNLHAHDERDDARIGDTVIVRECRPLSATKRWRLVEVVLRAK